MKYYQPLKNKMKSCLFQQHRWTWKILCLSKVSQRERQVLYIFTHYVESNICRNKQMRTVKQKQCQETEDKQAVNGGRGAGKRKIGRRELRSNLRCQVLKETRYKEEMWPKEYSQCFITLNGI